MVREYEIDLVEEFKEIIKETYITGTVLRGYTGLMETNPRILNFLRYMEGLQCWVPQKEDGSW